MPSRFWNFLNLRVKLNNCLHFLINRGSDEMSSSSPRLSDWFTFLRNGDNKTESKI